MTISHASLLSVQGGRASGHVFPWLSRATMKTAPSLKKQCPFIPSLAQQSLALSLAQRPFSLALSLGPISLALSLARRSHTLAQLFTPSLA